MGAHSLKGNSAFSTSTVPQPDNSIDDKRENSDADVEKSSRQSYGAYILKNFLWGARFILVIVVVGLPLAGPIIAFRNDQDLEDDESVERRQYRQLVFYLFSWLLISWLGAWISYALALAFPYLFRFIARYAGITSLCCSPESH